MKTINQQQLRVVNTLNQTLPPEGPCVIPVYMDFTSETQYTVDLQEFQTQKRFTQVQTLYIDLNGKNVDLTVTINNAQQVIVARRGTQGYYNVIVPNPANLVFTGSTGLGAIVVELVNVPIPGAVWPPSAGSVLLSASASLDFGNILDGTVAVLTFTLSGAVSGDGVIPAWPTALPTDFIGMMYVSAADTITVRLLNMSGGPVNPGALTFGAQIIR